MGRHLNDWRRTTVLFAITGLVESLAFGHLSAFTPLYLRQLRVPGDAIPSWTGILSAMAFVIGLPLLPFWGAWAERYGRKLIIVRSSVAGAAMFALAGLSTGVWMLAAARFLGGFVLGNTGVMMAVQAEITPRHRLGRAVAIVSAGAPVGMAVGPYAGGWVVELAGVRVLLLIDALLTALVAVALVVLLREEPRELHTRPASTGAGIREALVAISGTPAVAALFGVSFLLAFGLAIGQPFLPILVERVYRGSELPQAIGAVLTLSGALMALSTPLWGAAGDRAGHVRTLRLAAAAVGLTLAGQATASGVVSLGAWRAAQGACQGGLGAASMVLLALYSPPRRRAAILTLSLLPNQLSWFLGPLAGSAVSHWSVRAPFWVGAGAAALGWLACLRLPRPAAEGAPSP
ncbi:MAG: MFS transporter [Chthonomonadales bacterium]|nr:MFS transporter [Chthonomonadales bacterium]